MNAETITPSDPLDQAKQPLQPTLPPNERPSWQSRGINRILWWLRVRKLTETPAAVHDYLRKTALHPVPYAPKALGRGVEVRASFMEGWPVYQVAPTGNPQAGNLVVFLHGGGFIKEIVGAHWRFVGHLARQAQVRCVVPVYPLVPRISARDLVPATGRILRQILEEAGAAKVSVVGNSAGGNLALSATQWLRDAGCCLPDRLLLISPGLDFSISRPEQLQIAARDPVNDVPGTLEIARLYGGGLDVAHPYVSPLNGAMAGLPPMTVFAGTADFLYPDCVALAEKARAAGVAVDLHLREGQPHNYAGMPTPEGREALDLIVRAVA